MMSDHIKSRVLVGEVPALYSIFKGQVVSIQSYGVFIKIPGCSKNGLVHRSQVSNTAVDKLEEVLEIGEKVFCKVLSTEPDGNKIALSMKVVNQTTGKDLDPALVQTSLDEKHRKSVSSRDSKRIELGAIYDTTCRKCGGKGHLAQDCFYRPGDAKYDLIEDDLSQPVSKEGEASLDSGHKGHKKHKKEKKKKQKKVKREKSTPSSKHTADAPSDRKRGRSNSSSESESSRLAMSRKLPPYDSVMKSQTVSIEVQSVDVRKHCLSTRKRSRSSSRTRNNTRRRSNSSSSPDTRLSKLSKLSNRHSKGTGGQDSESSRRLSKETHSHRRK